ncbi:Retrovirus-related Pol polyprotein from transposon 17.6, partial [Mucuna pruriens]
MATVEENETRSGLKNQRRSGKTVEDRFPGSGGIAPMGGQHRASPQEGWESVNVQPIRMAPKDKEKTTFITTWGTFCYKVMPFGLKNAGATYQRAMVTLFHGIIHKEVEVYMDDMIAKSKTSGQHIDDLLKLFKRLRKYQLRLNPAKCTFGVGMGKLLGFIVNKRGIELDPDKVKAIQDMPAPKTETE